MKAIIPAAGLGTRLLPATKSMPKEMLPVVDKPVIQYVVEEAVAAGFDEIVIVTGRGKRAIEDHFDHSFELEHHLQKQGRADTFRKMREISSLARIHYVRQAEPRGLGDAILCAERFVGGEPFAILLGDDIVVGGEPPLGALLKAHKDAAVGAISVREVPHEDVSRYGVIRGKPVAEGSDVYLVEDIVEKPTREQAPSRLAAIGRYILTPDIFPLLREARPGHGGEIQLTDALSVLAQQGRLRAVEFRGSRFDVGSILGFLEANIAMSLRRGEIGKEVEALLDRYAGTRSA